MARCWYCFGEHLPRDCDLIQSCNRDLRVSGATDAEKAAGEPLQPVVRVVDFPVESAQAVKDAADRRRELAASTLDGFDFRAAIDRTWNSRTRLPL
jgi:hypothetical protein